MYRNLIQSLFLHERVITTESKAKIIRPLAEKLITRAKKQDLSARRRISAYLYTEEVANKLFHDIALRFKDRSGGYLRILKLGARSSDQTRMALIELVERKSKPDKSVKEEKGEKKRREEKEEKSNKVKRSKKEKAHEK